MQKLHRKAAIVDTSFDPRFEPTNTRGAWDKVRDNLENGMYLYILDRILELKALQGASTHQTFVDILDSGVIKPLEMMKVSRAWFGKAPLF